MSHPTRNWLLVPVLLLAIAGCGGSDASTTATTSTAAAPQPVAKFLAQADAICQEQGQRQKTDAPPAPDLDPTKPTPADLKAASQYFQAQLQFAKDEVDELAAVAPPEGKVAQWQAIVERYQDDLIPSFEDTVTATTAGDPDAFRTALKSLIKTGGELSSAAGDIGLKVCGS